AQSIAVDLEYYEDPAYYDTLHRAQQEAPYRPTRIVNGLIQVAQNGISLLGILGLVISFNWLLALVLLLAAFPGALVRLVYSRRLFGFDQEQTEKERRAWSYHNVLTDVPYAKEVRLFNLGTLFQTRYRDLQQQIRTGKLALSLRRVRADLLAQALAIAALFGSLAWIALQTVRGTVTLGDLMVYYMAFQSGLNFMQAVLRALAGLYEDNLFLTNLYQFLDLKPKIVAPPQPSPVPQPMPRAVAFHNLGFTYPSRVQETLHDIDLTLAPGQVIALVGENGSGKTTLVKLLCRLYDPTRGEITVDGVDLRALDPVQWRREISVAFQDYAHYALTAGENIWLGNVEAQPDPVRIAQAGRRSGADEFIRNLPQAYDTMLGHWFQRGQELSVGEWQKIALARTFWREAQLLILDEPSSSLDPLAEADLFHNFRALLNGRSAILISHRFSTVQMADCIHVMDQGRIVERGTHTALLAQNGHYARLYRAQAQHYQEK
ncbi:MAG: ABC transporter ATP-binding protein, partial [Chloroflexi bacterium]|nr:ABC transporter ATP-binding protein [Chloroflexota bacterium]